MKTFLRYFNIFLFAFAITLLLQMILPKPDQTPTVSTGVTLVALQKTIVIPNLPKLTITNFTSETFEIHPCEDLIWMVNNQELTGMGSGATEGYCHTFSLLGNATHTLDLNALATIFPSYPGLYSVTLHIDDTTSSAAFSLEQPGFFRSLLSSVIYEPIYNLFVAILTFLPGHELGFAIIIITIIIRLILLIPQHKMLENTTKMNRINPKIQALRKEYKDNQSELGVKMLELYKKEGVNPMGSCLPLLIQTPILIGLYWVISGISDHSNFYHLYSVFHGFDPQSIETNFFGLSLSAVGGAIGIIVALVLGGGQWLQAYLSFRYNKPKQSKVVVKDAENPEIAMLDPVTMQKMTLYLMPLVLAVTSFFFPYGVSLYWFIGTLFVIVQQAYVNQSHKKKSEKGELVRKNQSSRDKNIAKNTEKNISKNTAKNEENPSE